MDGFGQRLVAARDASHWIEERQASTPYNEGELEKNDREGKERGSQDNDKLMNLLK